MKIVIVGTDRMFEVRIINDRGLTTWTLTYRDLRQARQAAASWSAALPELPGYRSDLRVEAVNKYVRIRSASDHVDVELVEELADQQRMQKRSVNRTIDAARAAARTLARLNGGCAVKEPKPEQH